MTRTGAQIGDPHRGLLVVRHCLLVRLVVVEGARPVREIQVAENRKVEPREMEVRDESDRLLVARTRFSELAFFAVNQAELVVRNRMARVDLERAREARHSLVEITRAAI